MTQNSGGFSLKQSIINDHGFFGIEEDKEEELIRVDRQQIVISCDEIVSLLENKLKEISKMKESLQSYVVHKMEMQAKQFINITVDALNTI